MNQFAKITLALLLSASGAAFAQSGNMKDMPMDSKSHGDMKGMDMKGMDMKGMDMKGQGSDKQGESHMASATVKSADAAKGTVTLSHEPIKSLKWPAMTMGFSVKDKALFEKLSPGNKVQVEFVKQGSEYVVTSVK
ncbi:copper-binding protein [Noviherbaspirillum sp. CPCC 100848]|uniref:Copper-binding protein n=1 Tax=Noviherbaspirillum album TaxID=3080276 RepID=A0ABU6JFG5_9BURK|nr:copper-binding protein [Noviherbaspirillum sp. CPCC 100848]MEC4722265.1 copper-binding protein [Noviherbaspirillum sp. CPCC 100848]